MATLFLAGTGFNFLSTAASITASPAADILYPVANLHDGRPAKPFKYGSDTTDPTLTFDWGSAKNTDFCSVHGHNIDSGVTAIQFRSSTDNFGAVDTLEATMTRSDPSFYTRLPSPVNRRYWRLKFVGNNTVGAIKLGEVVVGLASVVNVDPTIAGGIDTAHERPQIRQRTRSGDTQVYNLTDFEQRTVEIEFRSTRTNLEQIRDSIFRATGWGATPLVFVPDSTLPTVLFCKIPGRWSDMRELSDLYKYGLSLEELPFYSAAS